MGTRYHGKSGSVYASTSGSGAAVKVASLSDWTLDMATDIVDVTAMGDANKQYVQGLRDMKGTLAGFWDSADDTLFTGMQSTDGIVLYLYPSTNAASKYLYGPAWLNLSLKVGVKGSVDISANFVANGAWGIDI